MSFSKRNNYKSPEKEIVTREAAPTGLRAAILQIAYATGFIPSTTRKIICRILRVQPDTESWSEYPNIDRENHYLLNNCEWFKVYDIIEALAAKAPQQEEFVEEINDYFHQEGIGWHLVKGEITYRGSESFEAELRKAGSVLADAGLQTSASELRKAIDDLSRRPEADITGAVQHSLASLECAAREVTGSTDGKETLGPVLKKNPGLVPPPLNEVAMMIFGFGSNHGRHLREGKEPAFEEAELLVGLSAAISTYLSRKFKPSTGTFTLDEDDNGLPF